MAPRMKESKKLNCCDCKTCTCKTQANACGNSSGAVYGIGVVGAIVYFFQNANTITDYVLGVLKGLIWPGMLVYKALELLKF